MQGNYSVKIEDFAQKHFIKGFEKKYNNHWDVTLKAIIFGLERIDALLQTDVLLLGIRKSNLYQSCSSTAKLI